MRKVFDYRRFESVKGHFCEVFVCYLWICVLIVCLLLYDCLKSENSVVMMCAEVSADDEDVVRLCNEFSFALKWSSKAEIKEAVL